MASAGFFDWWVQNFFFNPTYGSSVEFTANYYENIFQDNYRYILGKSENVIQVKATLDRGNHEVEVTATFQFCKGYRGHCDKYGAPEDPDEPDTMELKSLEPDIEILSSSGGNKYHNLVELQKKNWIETMNLPEWKVNVVAGRKKKAEFATPDSILIDDTQDVIEAFREAGGIGIHHKDVGNTIMLLDIYLNRA